MLVMYLIVGCICVKKLDDVKWILSVLFLGEVILNYNHSSSGSVFINHLITMPAYVGAINGVRPSAGTAIELTSHILSDYSDYQ